MITKQRTLADYGFILMVTIIVAVAMVHFRNAQVDDAFITYRYAQAIASGQGFSYNPFEVILGTTTPLYTVLLALAGFLNLPIPAISLVLNGASLIALTAIVYFLVTAFTNRWVGLIAAACVVIIPGSYMNLGMETLLYTACIYGALGSYAKKQYTGAAVISAVVTLLRYDGALVGGLVLLGEWIDTKRLPWKNGILYGLLLLPWLITATWLFGSPLPNTFSAKAGYFDNGNPFLDELPAYLASLLAYRWVEAIPVGIIGLTLLLFGIGLIVAGRTQRLRFLASWVLLYLIAYTNLRLYYVHPWYYYPVLPGSLILIALGIWASVQWLRQVPLNLALDLDWLAPKLGLGIALILVVMVGTGGLEFWESAETATIYGGRYRMYTEAADWLCQNTPPEATVAVPEIGIIGWHCPRKIIDPYGLVTPQMIPYIRNNDRLGGVADLRPDYIVLQDISAETEHPTLPEPDRFHHPYAVVKIVTQPDFPQMVVIFAKQEK